MCFIPAKQQRIDRLFFSSKTGLQKYVVVRKEWDSALEEGRKCFYVLHARQPREEKTRIKQMIYLAVNAQSFSAFKFKVDMRSLALFRLNIHCPAHGFYAFTDGMETGSVPVSIGAKPFAVVFNR